LQNLKWWNDVVLTAAVGFYDRHGFLQDLITFDILMIGAFAFSKLLINFCNK